MKLFKLHPLSAVIVVDAIADAYQAATIARIAPEPKGNLACSDVVDDDPAFHHMTLGGLHTAQEDRNFPLPPCRLEAGSLPEKFNELQGFGGSTTGSSVNVDIGPSRPVGG